MTRSQLAKQIRQCLHVKTPSRTLLLETAQNAARYGDVPYIVFHSAYGIQWAYATGRLPASVEAAIDAMTTAELTRLVADAAIGCENIGEVPRYLIAKYQPRMTEA